MSTTKQRLGLASSHNLLAAAEDMLPQIRDAADSIDEARRLPDWLAERLAGAGFFHLLTGREHGGMDADPVTAAKVIETLSTASPSVGWGTMILATASFWTVRMVPEELRREIFAEVSPGEIQPTVIAGTLVPHGRAERVEGGWRLSGQWPFASGCHQATWMPTAAWLHDARRPCPQRRRRPRVAGVPPSGDRVRHPGHLAHLRPARDGQPRLHHGKRVRGRQLRQETLPLGAGRSCPTSGTSTPPSTCRCSRR